MTEKLPQPNMTNDYPTRVAILEQSFVALAQDMGHQREKVDRLNAYIFGSDRDEDGMKYQMKTLVKQVEMLMKAWDDGSKEGRLIQKQGFERIEALEDRQKVLDEWKTQQTELSKDRKGLSRQYTFMLVSTIAGSSISFVIGWLLNQLMTP